MKPTLEKFSADTKKLSYAILDLIEPKKGQITDVESTLASLILVISTVANATGKPDRCIDLIAELAKYAASQKMDSVTLHEAMNAFFHS